MSMSVDQAFIRQYEAEVHETYERKGSLLRGTVRTKNGVVGESTTFQIIGSLSAVQKTRHGVVPTGNAAHTNAVCALADWYVAEEVDKLDELKTNIDERGVLVRKTVQALGRKTDDLIIAALNSASTTISPTLGGMTFEKAQVLVQTFGERDVPFDGNIFCAVPWAAWVDLMGIEEFANGEWTGDHPIKNFTQTREWFGIKWFPHSALTTTAHAYHMDAIGHAIGQEVYSDFWWNGDKQAWKITAGMSMGAVEIDDEGSLKVTIN